MFPGLVGGKTEPDPAGDVVEGDDLLRYELAVFFLLERDAAFDKDLGVLIEDVGGSLVSAREDDHFDSTGHVLNREKSHDLVVFGILDLLFRDDTADHRILAVLQPGDVFCPCRADRAGLG